MGRLGPGRANSAYRSRIVQAAFLRVSRSGEVDDVEIRQTVIPDSQRGNYPVFRIGQHGVFIANHAFLWVLILIVFAFECRIICLQSKRALQAAHYRPGNGGRKRRRTNTWLLPLLCFGIAGPAVTALQPTDIEECKRCRGRERTLAKTRVRTGAHQPVEHARARTDFSSTRPGGTGV